MSVTFTANGAPCESVRRPCSSPSMGLTCTAEERCGYCEDGQEWADEYAVPPVDMTNAMARIVFNLLGVEGDSEHGLVGSIEHAALPFLLQRCMVVLGKEGVRAPHLSEGGEVPRTVRVGVREDGLPTLTTGARVIEAPVGDERVVRCVTQLRDLLSTCAQQGWGVSWS